MTATGAVIGNETIQPLVPGADQEIKHALLGDRVTDLHGSNRGIFVELLGGEGGAVNGRPCRYGRQP